MTGHGDSAGYQWHPQGDKVGWVDDEGVYLDPDAAYRVVQSMAGSGDGIGITQQVMRKRLAERGLLIRDPNREELTVRRVMEGLNWHVLYLRRAAVLPVPEPAGSAPPPFAGAPAAVPNGGSPVQPPAIPPPATERRKPRGTAAPRRKPRTPPPRTGKY